MLHAGKFLKHRELARPRELSSNHSIIKRSSIKERYYLFRDHKRTTVLVKVILTCSDLLESNAKLMRPWYDLWPPVSVQLTNTKLLWNLFFVLWHSCERRRGIIRKEVSRHTSSVQCWRGVVIEGRSVKTSIGNVKNDAFRQKYFCMFAVLLADPKYCGTCKWRRSVLRTKIHL
jgi:hypothetical protein